MTEAVTSNDHPEQPTTPEKLPPANPTERIQREYISAQTAIFERRFSLSRDAYDLSQSEVKQLSPDLRANMSEEAVHNAVIATAEAKAAQLRAAARDEEELLHQEYLDKLNARLDVLNAAVYDTSGVSPEAVMHAATANEESLIAIMDASLRAGALEAFDLALQEAEAKGFDLAYEHGLSARGENDPNWAALVEEKVYCESLLSAASRVNLESRFDAVFGSGPGKEDLAAIVAGNVSG